jgi:hypothetical protein
MCWIHEIIVRGSVSSVSALNFSPISTIVQPIMRLIPKTNGYGQFIFEDISIVIKGAHAPIINPELKTKPAEVFLICIGNFSDSNTGNRCIHAKNFLTSIRKDSH